MNPLAKRMSIRGKRTTKGVDLGFSKGLCHSVALHIERGIKTVQLTNHKETDVEVFLGDCAITKLDWFGG